MSGEDGEVDDGPPVLVAFEYPPEDNGNEMPLDNEEPNERINDVNNNNNNNANNDGTPSEDEGGDASQLDAEAEEGEDQESNTSKSKSRRGSKRRHHRKPSRHRKMKDSSKSSSSSQNVVNNAVNAVAKEGAVVAPPPIDYHNLVGAPVVGEWATLLNMYQQQFPAATGDEGRGVSSKIATDNSSPSKNSRRKDQTTDATKLLTTGKSQYEVDDVDPYATPEGSDDEQQQGVSGPQQFVNKEPLGNNNSAYSNPYEITDYQNNYQQDQSFPPRKRMRDESFGGDRSSPFRGGPPPRDRYYGGGADRGGRAGFRQGGGYDDFYDDRRGSRSPGDWRGGGNRRDRGGMNRRGGRDRHDVVPRRGRNDYNDYDQPPPEVVGPPPSSINMGYESHSNYDDRYGPGPGPGPMGQEPPPYHPHHQPQEVPPPFQPPPPLPAPPQQEFDRPPIDRNYQHNLPPPPPENYPDEMRHRFRDEDGGFDGGARGGRRGDRGGMRGPGRKNDRLVAGPPGGPDRGVPPPQQQPPEAPPSRQNAPPERPGMICKFFREGNCLKGSNCNFAHILPGEIKRKPELCKFYLGGFCIKGNDCDYLHEQFPCKFFHTSGNCRNGDHCRFSHAPLDEEARKMLDKAVASWSGTGGQGGPGEQGFYQGDDQQQQQQEQQGPGFPPPQQPPGQFNGNGIAGPPPGFYGVDLLGGPAGDQSIGGNVPQQFQSPPQQLPPQQPQIRPPFMPPVQLGGFDLNRPPYEAPPPPFHGDFMPPPPNFAPPFMGQTGPQQPPPSGPLPFYPPADLSSPPQFRPPGPPIAPGFPPSSPSYQTPQMPPLPHTLSAEQIHQLASGMPPGMPLPPFMGQSPPSMLPLPGPGPGPIGIGGESGATSPNARDPRLSVNRTSSDAATVSTNNANRLVRYKLISVLIPPPVPLSLALRLDPMDPIIRLDPRLRKVFGVATTNP